METDGVTEWLRRIKAPFMAIFCFAAVKPKLLHSDYADNYEAQAPDFSFAL